MTRNIFLVSAAAFGLAASVSLSSFGAARADTSDTPSLSEPAPTPGWVEGGPALRENTATPVSHPSRAYMRRHASRNGHSYVRYGGDPMGAAAAGVVGGVADMGSIAAYPIYCFPNYGSCPVRWFHRF